MKHEVILCCDHEYPGGLRCIHCGISKRVVDLNRECKPEEHVIDQFTNTCINCGMTLHSILMQKVRYGQEEGNNSGNDAVQTS